MVIAFLIHYQRFEAPGCFVQHLIETHLRYHFDAFKRCRLATVFILSDIQLIQYNQNPESP
jgi:hypothetical protein